jgi:chemotaxis protein histidine kinase CheA
MSIRPVTKLTIALVALSVGLGTTTSVLAKDDEAAPKKGLFKKVFHHSEESKSDEGEKKSDTDAKKAKTKDAGAKESDDKKAEKSAKEKSKDAKSSDNDEQKKTAKVKTPKADEEKKAAKSDDKKAAKAAKERDSDKSEKNSKAKQETAVAPKEPVKAPLPELRTDAVDSNPFQLDSSLLSVMRDINKSLRESEELPKLEEPAQRAALKATLEALEVALGKAAISPNRIVNSANRDRFEKSVAAESWESGDISLPNGGHVSLNVLWSKKVNGLLNITVSGNCGCRANGDGEKAGEFVAVINGKSTLDSGFDIQSQSNVNFWLGKLNNFSVDATTCGDKEAAEPAKKVLLKALMTDAQRRYLIAHPPKDSVDGALIAAKKPSSAGTEINKEASAAGVKVEETSPAQSDASPTHETHVVYSPPVAEKRPTSLATLGLQPDFSTSVKKKTNVFVDSTRLPSQSARILTPKRAIAGQYVTVSVLNATDRPEPFVELNFNDYKSCTNEAGMLVFQVPEDAAPGPSLMVAFTARPEHGATTIDVIQPLMPPSETDLPKIDKVVHHSGESTTLVLEGHNFDGIADHNHITVDGSINAKVVFASPVQLKAVLPHALEAGNHAVIVQRNGMRSAPLSCVVARQKPDTLVIKTRTRKKS